MTSNYPDTTYAGDPRAPWNEPNPPECPKCYATLDEDWKFCPYCGKPIDWEEYEVRDR